MEKQYFYKEMYFSKRSKYFYIRFTYASTIRVLCDFLICSVKFEFNEKYQDYIYSFISLKVR